MNKILNIREILNAKVISNIKIFLNKKNILIAIIVTIIIVAISLVFAYIKNEPKRVVDNFLREAKSSNFDKSQNYLDKVYSYSDQYLLSEENLKLRLSKTKYNIKELVVIGDNATVEVSINRIDLTDTLKENLQNTLKNISASKTDEEIRKQRDDLVFKNLTADAGRTDLVCKLNLIKIDGKWKIVNDQNLSVVLAYGTPGDTTPNDAKEKQNIASLQQKYIDDSMEISNPKITTYDGYSGKAVGLEGFTIKNKGDKYIKAFTLTVYFKDETGKNIAEQSFNITEKLNPNYSWKMSSGNYYTFDNLPSNVDINKNETKITKIEEDENFAFVDDKKSDYINKNIEILSGKVKINDGYLGKAVGLSNIELKNNGDKDITSITIAIYFKDATGKYIAESDQTLSENLKAGYSWKMEDGVFYTIDNLADEVDISNYDIKISDIKY